MAVEAERASAIISTESGGVGGLLEMI